VPQALRHRRWSAGEGYRKPKRSPSIHILVTGSTEIRSREARVSTIAIEHFSYLAQGFFYQNHRFVNARAACQEGIQTVDEVANFPVHTSCLSNMLLQRSRNQLGIREKIISSR
jgi:hypothetical protein